MSTESVFLIESFTNYLMQGYDRPLEQSLDAIKSKINWINRDRKDVEEWLKQNGY